MSSTCQSGLLCPPHQYLTERGGYQERYTPGGATVSVTTALENHRFPIYLGKNSKCLPHWQKRERGFFNSLSYLEALYGFKANGADEFPYPQNIQMASLVASHALRDFHPLANMSILTEKDNTTFVATSMEYESPFDFYHFPIEHIFRLIENKDFGPEVGLLLSLCHYLYRVLDIDFYADEGAFVNYEIDCIRESFLFEPDEYTESMIDEIDKTLKNGRIFQRLMVKSSNLTQLARRVKKFRPKDDRGEQLLHLASQTLKLYEQYGKRSVTRTMYPSEGFGENDLDPYADDDTFNAYRRFSFVWDIRSEMYDNLWRSITDLANSLNGSCEEPRCYQLFKEPQSTITMSLDFEIKAFDLMDQIGDFFMYDIWKI